MKQCYMIIAWNIAGFQLIDGPYNKKETAIALAKDMRDNEQVEGELAVIGPIDFEQVE